MGRISGSLIGLALAFSVSAQSVDELLGAKDGEYVSVTPAEAVSDGLPPRTGHGGECAKVTADASGFEYGECGGGADLSDTPAVALSATAGAGSAAEASRQDHVHPQTGVATTAALTAAESAAAAHRQVPNPGAGGVNNGDVLTRSSPTAYGWAAPSGGGGGAALSDTAAVALSAIAGAGSASQASRQDHVHPQTGLATTRALTSGLAGKPNLSSNAPAALAAAAAAGSGTHASRSDHVHPQTGLATAAALTTVDNAAKAHRQVPDPAHIADGHVLTANSGAYAFAAIPGGGGSGGGGGLVAVQALKTLSKGVAPADHGISGNFDVRGDTTNFDLLSAGATLLVVIRQSDPSSDDQVDHRNIVIFLSAVAPLTRDTGGAYVRFYGTLSRALWGANYKWATDDTDFNCSVNLPRNPATARITFSCEWGDADNSVPWPSGTTWVDDGDMTTVSWGMYLLPAAGGGGGTATPLSDGLPKIEGTAAAGTGTAASRGDHVHPRVLPKPAAGTADKGKTFGIASDGQTLQIWDPYVVVNSGIPDFDGKAGECLVVSGDDESDYAVAYQPCDDVAEIERDIDGLQAITGDILLGRAEPGPAWVLNSLDKSGGIAWITGSSLTPDLQNVTFQTNTVARPGSGWGVGSMIIRIIDSEDVRQWQQRDSLPGSANVDISHWPGNLWRLISPTNATAGYHYYLAHSPPNTSTVTQARLFRTNTSAHFGETEYYGKTPLVDAQIAALLKAPRRKLERSGTSTGCCNNDFLVVGTAQELANLAERVRDASTETITQLELHISYTTANSGTARRILPMGGMPLGVNGGTTETNDFIGQHANLELFADGQFRLAADFNSGNTTVTWQVISITEQTKQ